MTVEAMPWGVDVSNWQGQVDWAAVKAAGAGFGFAKASEGNYYRDPYFGANWIDMQAVGLVRGAYHFAQPDECGPETEADWFLAMVLDYGELVPGDLLALDLEVGSGPLTDWAYRFSEHLAARLGFRPLLYTSRGFIADHGLSAPALGSLGLWLAHWTPELPEPPDPWSYLAVWQYTDSAQVPGVSGGVDGNRCPIGLEALRALGAGGTIAPPDPVVPLPRYDWQYPTCLQQHDWDCSQESCYWMLHAWGRTPDQAWMEQCMIEEGVVSINDGCLDRTGAGIADWCNRWYAVDGYWAENQVWVSFDQVAQEAGSYKHATQIGGEEWYHWSAVRGYDPVTDLLLLANPAPGYRGVGQAMTRDQFRDLGPFNLVRLTHPQAEGGGPVDDPYAPWIDGGKVGSGLIEMMKQDNTLPAQRASTWLPLGTAPPSDVEECLGENGVMYRWALGVNRGWRYRPA